jgi:glycine C-acetyltransferase
MNAFLSHLDSELRGIRDSGLWKQEAEITSPQNARFTLQGRDGDYINFCANNYLGLSDHPDIVAAAAASLETRGFGMSSVRFICGTQDQHRRLESELAGMLGQDDAILYSSCFDANGGLFETLLGPEDAVISDELNHASIIDGVRLCKAKRFRYKNRDTEDLRARLTEAREAGARHILIATDGVFSMDGTHAPLDKICEAAEDFGALVMVDDSHAVGFVGKTGAGTPELFGVQDRVDIITGTLGKALGGASGGYTAARQQIVDMLRQRSRPYLFSNSLAPPIVAASLKALELGRNHPEIREKLWENTEYVRNALAAMGFDLPGLAHPIIPIMFYDEKKAVAAAAAMMEKRIYAVAFSFPVVPRGLARVRVQISAAHGKDDLDELIAAISASR